VNNYPKVLPAYTLNYKDPIFLKSEDPKGAISTSYIVFACKKAIKN
jgi:hypothetical protein